MNATIPNSAKSANMVPTMAPVSDFPPPELLDGPVVEEELEEVAVVISPTEVPLELYTDCWFVWPPQVVSFEPEVVKN